MRKILPSSFQLYWEIEISLHIHISYIANMSLLPTNGHVLFDEYYTFKVLVNKYS